METHTVTEWCEITGYVPTLPPTFPFNGALSTEAFTKEYTREEFDTLMSTNAI